MPRAVIIGAGIGGLTAAIALSKPAGMSRFTSELPELREVGAGITLWTNAVKVLRKLGVGEAIEGLAAPIRESEVRTWRGRLLMRTDFGSLNQKLGRRPSASIARTCRRSSPITSAASTSTSG